MKKPARDLKREFRAYFDSLPEETRRTFLAQGFNPDEPFAADLCLMTKANSGRIFSLTNSKLDGRDSKLVDANAAPDERPDPDGFGDGDDLPLFTRNDFLRLANRIVSAFDLTAHDATLPTEFRVAVVRIAIGLPDAKGVKAVDLARRYNLSQAAVSKKVREVREFLDLPLDTYHGSAGRAKLVGVRKPGRPPKPKTETTEPREIE